jgi:hypothetical protein
MTRLSIRALRFLALGTWLVLGGCSQVHSDFTERSISLEPGDLERGGLAIVTPSTVTGQEEEKQAVALSFTDVLQSERPEIPIVTLAEVLSKVNTAGLNLRYKEMYGDYRNSGLFERESLREIAEILEMRYLAQLKLQGFSQGGKKRLDFFGLRIVQTEEATLRLFLQIWDARDGTIAWEGLEEIRRSQETVVDDPVTLQDIMKRAAKEMIDKLPETKARNYQAQ